MPPKMIHCRECRALLNKDLQPDSVEIPRFVPLREIESTAEVPIRGYFVQCPICTRELRVNVKFGGQQVTCNSCEGSFALDFRDANLKKLGLYVNCPHCAERLRMNLKYAGIKVACKSCSGRLKVVG
jgi:transcription elongation factor Elf1